MDDASFGIISIGFVTWLLLWLTLAIWIARHPWPEGVLRRAAHAADAAGGMHRSVYRHMRAWISSLSRWMSVSEAVGVGLLVGFVAVVALAVGFTQVFETVLEGDGIAVVDQPISRWLALHRDPWLTTALRVFTNAGSGVALGLLTTVVCAVSAWRHRSWLPVALGLVGAAGIALVIAIAKALVGRDRPPMEFAVIAERGYSFPSGHATGTMAVALLCAWLLTRSLITSWAARVAVWATAIGGALAIGFSRVYLGVHYVSDVLAGWLLGGAWAAAVILVGSWWADARAARTPGGASATDV